jgi:hypothetical protein
VSRPGEPADRQAEWPRPGDLVLLDHRAGPRFKTSPRWGQVVAVSPARSAPGWFYADVDLLDDFARPMERMLVFSCPDWLILRRR